MAFVNLKARFAFPFLENRNIAITVFLFTELVMQSPSIFCISFEKIKDIIPGANQSIDYENIYHYPS